MPPCFASRDVPNMPTSHVVVAPDLGVGFACCEPRTNGANISLGKFCEVTCLSAPSAIPTASQHVSRVLAHCSKVQMIGPDAGRDITLVQDEEVFGNWSIRKHPTSSVSTGPMGSRHGFPKATIALRHPMGSNPEPATVIGFDDLVPESLFSRTLSGHRGVHSFGVRPAAGDTVRRPLHFTKEG